MTFIFSPPWSILRFPECLQRASPRDQLIEHVIDRLFFCRSRLEDAEVFEVGKHGEQDLVTNGGHLDLGQHQTQLLDRAHSLNAAVANEASRLVVPLGKQEIDRVLERARDAMVVLGRDENVSVERADLGGPYFGVRLTVLPHGRRHWLVEKRQVDVFDVYEFELGVAALLRDLVNPFTYGLAVATRAGASDDDGNLYHVWIPLCWLLLFNWSSRFRRGRSERCSNERSNARPQELDRAHEFSVRQRRDTHLKREARDAA